MRTSILSLFAASLAVASSVALAKDQTWSIHIDATACKPAAGENVPTPIVLSRNADGSPASRRGVSSDGPPGKWLIYVVQPSPADWQGTLLWPTSVDPKKQFEERLDVQGIDFVLRTSPSKQTPNTVSIRSKGADGKELKVTKPITTVEFDPDMATFLTPQSKVGITTDKPQKGLKVVYCQPAPQVS